MTSVQKTIIGCLLILFLIVVLSFQHLSFTYTKTIETKHSSEQLWTLLTQALQSSTTSSIWPNEKEIVTSESLVRNGRLSVEYNLPFGKNTQTYTISDIRYGILSYQTTNTHPLRGGGTISVIPRSNGSALSWRVEYRYRLFSPAGWYVRLFYTPKFFEALEKKLSAQ